MEKGLKAELDDYLEAEVPRFVETHLGMMRPSDMWRKPLVPWSLESTDRKNDPYRTTIHFLAGLLTFCLGVIAAVFGALLPLQVASIEMCFCKT